MCAKYTQVQELGVNKLTWHFGWSISATVKPKPGGGTDVQGSGTTRIVNTLHCTIITSLIVLTLIM
jgi:hypothetical protein